MKIRISAIGSFFLLIIIVLSSASNILVQASEKNLLAKKGGTTSILNYESNSNIQKIASEKVNDQITEDYHNLVFYMHTNPIDNLENEIFSDVILVLSINKKNEKVKVIPIDSETYLNLEADYYDRVEVAYSQGGIQQLVTSLNNSLDLNITDFIKLEIQDFIRIIDKLGGLTCNLDTPILNFVDSEFSLLLKNYDIDYDFLQKEGEQILDGIQVLAYRSVTATPKLVDYNIIRSLLNEFKNKEEMIELIDDVFPQISTSFNIQDFKTLMSELPYYNLEVYSLFPYTSYNTSKGVSIGVVPSSLESNVISLQNILFEDIKYEVSEVVKAYSKQIIDIAPYTIRWREKIIN